MAESPAIPRMTRKHVNVIYLSDTNDYDDRPFLRDIESLVRGIVSGEIVCVPRKEIEAVREKIEETTGGDMASADALDIISRWLLWGKP